jgi:gas vesicle protein
LNQNRNTKLLLFAAGMTIGAAAGVLLAPAPGVETRRRLADKAQSTGLIERTREFYETGLRIAEEAAELFEDGRKLVKG